tara:strand:- start:654 stop:1259 length:606 start_codon:yes stop_codon:yes gene_type:complete
MENHQSNQPFKLIALGLGSVIAIAHIGVLGHLINATNQKPVMPSINLPTGPYSSYDVNVGKDGYSIRYNANDPKTLKSERTLDLEAEKSKSGFFGNKNYTDETRKEWRIDEYTAEGYRNIKGGDNTDLGKSNAKSADCIAADAGARSQGAMAGSAIAAGVAAPAVTGIPYIGWLASGWALLLGQKVGESAGSVVGGMFNDC